MQANRRRVWNCRDEIRITGAGSDLCGSKNDLDIRTGGDLYIEVNAVFSGQVATCSYGGYLTSSGA